MTSRDNSSPATPRSDRGRVKDGVLQEAVGGIPAGERLLNLPEASESMGVVVTKVMDLINTGKLIQIKVDGVRYVPARFFNEEDGDVNRFVPGVLALFADGGYQDEEVFEYLFTEDDTLPGRPVDALHGHLAREVRRRVQAMAIS